MARDRDQQRHITVTDRAGLPYSKGLMASAIMATGLAPGPAFEVAERIEHELVEAEQFEITRAELIDIASRTLSEVVGSRYADLYRKWQAIERLDLPLVVLIGGSTGVGKSTIATQLAARLGITRVVGTDAIREVMRSIFNELMLPTLHTSSFEADTAVRGPLPRSSDPVIVGFEEQVRAVSVGVDALIQRAVLESADTVIEGAHLVPGYIAEAWQERAVVVPLVITVEDEDLHRSHFYLRGQDSTKRNVDRYLTAFGNIRKVQRYIKSQALQRGVPVIPSYSLDATLATVIDHIVSKAVEQTEGLGAAVDVSASTGRNASEGR